MGHKAKNRQTETGMIPEDWDVSKVKDVARINELSITKDFKEKEIEYIDIASVENRQLLNVQHLSISEAPSRAKRIVRDNDILISTVRPNLKHFTFINKAKPNTIASTGFAVISSFNIHPQYLYYYLTTDEFTDFLSRIADAHTSAYPACNPDVIENADVAFPSDLEEQRAIAEVLGALDDKIAVNLQMNENLERIGQALFKRWFIDFEIPNEKGKPYKSSGGEMVDSELGEIPKGWEIKPLGEVASFLRGFSYSGAEKFSTPNGYVFVTLNNVKEGGGFKPEYAWIKSDRLKEHHFLKQKDLIITNTEQTKDGRLLAFPAIVYFPQDYEEKVGVFSHHITRVVPKDMSSKYFLYYFLLLTQNESVAFHTGSVIWGLDVNNFANHRHVVWAPTHIMAKFDEMADNLFEKIILNQMEMSGLSRIRDSLLPRLMSGKIRVAITKTEQRVA